MSGGSPYARKYKEKTAEYTAAAERVRAKDRERAVELGKVLVELDEARQRASRAAAVRQFVVEIHWEAALEALWSESWLEFKPKPVARPGRTPHEPEEPMEELAVEMARLRTLDAELAKRSEQLHAALSRSRWAFTFRRG